MAAVDPVVSDPLMTVGWLTVPLTDAPTAGLVVAAAPRLGVLTGVLDGAGVEVGGPAGRDDGLLVVPWLSGADDFPDCVTEEQVVAVGKTVALLAGWPAEALDAVHSPKVAWLLGPLLVSVEVCVADRPRVSACPLLLLLGLGTLTPTFASMLDAVDWAAPGKLPVAAAAPVLPRATAMAAAAALVVRILVSMCFLRWVGTGTGYPRIAALIDATVDASPADSVPADSGRA